MARVKPSNKVRRIRRNFKTWSTEPLIEDEQEHLKPSEVLVLAGSLVEAGWSRVHYAIDKNGDECDMYSSEASAWCSETAIIYAAGHDSAARACEAFESINGIESINEWNSSEERTHQEVINVFKDTVAMIPFHPQFH